MPSSERRAMILAAAADLVCRRGYEGASMRAIAAAAGILIPTIYHYVSSKEELIHEAHRQGVERISSQVRDALTGVQEPWARLEAAVVAHVEALLSPDPFCRMVQTVLPAKPETLRQELIRQRDGYEALLRDLLADLSLRPGIDPGLFRRSLIGMANAVPLWYRTGAMAPREIAEALVAMLRDGTRG